MSTERGMTNGEVRVATGYDEANIWNTMRTLESKLGIVEEIHTAGPQRWRLTQRYRPAPGAEFTLGGAEQR
jgi:hypothetical protein